MRRARGPCDEKARAADEAPLRLKSFMLKKNGHTYVFVFPPEHERAALRALGCCGVGKLDAIALACYLGHDPRELGLADA